MAHKFRQSGIPKKYRTAKLSHYRVEDEWGNAEALEAVDDYVVNLRQYRQEGKGLYLHGPPGGGKTMLASIVGVYALREALTVRYFAAHHFLEMQHFIMDMKAAWDKGYDPDAYEQWKAKKELMTALRNSIDFVIIDDFGKEHKTASNYAQDQMDFLLRYRNDKGLPTIITTNMTDKEVNAGYGWSMESFIREAFIKVSVKAEDYRARAK